MMAGGNQWNDEQAYAVSERAYLLHTEGRYRESLTLFAGLLEIYPDNVYYMDAIAALHLAMGNPETAVRMASAVLEREPRHIRAYVRRCEAYACLRMLEEAEADVRRLRQLGAHHDAQRMAMRLVALQRDRSLPSARPVKKFALVRE